MSAGAEGRLGGKVSLITGASRGIGAAIARAMAREGAQVVLASRKLEGLREVADQITEAGGTAEPIACHIGHDEARRALVAQAIERFGRIDVLVNNAATNPHFGPMLSVDWGAFRKTFEVNVEGYFGLTREVALHLRARKAPGSILSVSSVMGTMAAPLQGVYGMTKAAVISMTRTLAMELGSDGIRVNALAPGLIETKFAAALTSNEAIRERIVARTALGRVGVPEDVAGAAVFLCSDEASYVTGHVLTIDAGWTLG
ncbi:MAG: glucose 1-dehydrogenase [Myxococcales bacterium]|nr:glucose 1-dehydrogenase [Myxococcales bacterium]